MEMMEQPKFEYVPGQGHKKNRHSVKNLFIILVFPT